MVQQSQSYLLGSSNDDVGAAVSLELRVTSVQEVEQFLHHPTDVVGVDQRKRQFHGTSVTQNAHNKLLPKSLQPAVFETSIFNTQDQKVGEKWLWVFSFPLLYSIPFNLACDASSLQCRLYNSMSYIVGSPQDKSVKSKCTIHKPILKSNLQNQW